MFLFAPMVFHSATFAYAVPYGELDSVIRMHDVTQKRDPMESQSGHEDAVLLEKLASELDSAQFAVVLVAVNGRRPCVRVASRATAQLAEDIYAADGFYWWSWAEKIAPVAEVTAAATRISCVLATGL